ncbi:MAG: hypothetical protein IT558_00190 [Alphaproteobacteria bacterium]|nr:hypothetical protein [Alphaproteobacteria bacterium]
MDEAPTISRPKLPVIRLQDDFNARTGSNLSPSQLRIINKALSNIATSATGQPEINTPNSPSTPGVHFNSAQGRLSIPGSHALIPYLLFYYHKGLLIDENEPPALAALPPRGEKKFLYNDVRIRLKKDFCDRSGIRLQFHEMQLVEALAYGIQCKDIGFLLGIASTVYNKRQSSVLEKFSVASSYQLALKLLINCRDHLDITLPDPSDPSPLVDEKTINILINIPDQKKMRAALKNRYRLSSREIILLKKTIGKFSQDDLPDTLNITRSTFSTHIRNICEKCGVRPGEGKYGLMLKLEKEGLVRFHVDSPDVHLSNPEQYARDHFQKLANSHAAAEKSKRTPKNMPAGQPRYAIRLKEDHNLPLTIEQEWAVECVLSGIPPAQLAGLLDVLPTTTRAHLAKANANLGVSGRRGLAQYFLDDPSRLALLEIANAGDLDQEGMLFAIKSQLELVAAGFVGKLEDYKPKPRKQSDAPAACTLA